MEALVLWKEAAELWGSDGNLQAKGSVYADVALNHRLLGSRDSARAYYRRALQSLRGAGDRNLEAFTLYKLGEFHLEAGHPDSAVRVLNRALDLRQELEDSAGVAKTLLAMGLVHFELGQLDSALFNWKRSPALRQDAELHEAMGLLYLKAASPDSALAHFHVALRLREAADESSAVLTILDDIADVHRELGQPDSAIYYLRVGIPLYGRTDNRSDEAIALRKIGELYVTMARPDSAVLFLRPALAHGASGDQGRTLLWLGAALNRLQQPDSALTYLLKALPLQHGDRRNEALTRGEIGTALLAVGRPDSASVHLELALRFFEDSGEASYATPLRNSLAGALWDTGAGRVKAVATPSGIANAAVVTFSLDPAGVAFELRAWSDSFPARLALIRGEAIVSDDAAAAGDTAVLSVGPGLAGRWSVVAGSPPGMGGGTVILERGEVEPGLWPQTLTIGVARADSLAEERARANREGRLEDALRHGRAALAAREALLGAERPELSDDLFMLGALLQSDGRSEEAEPFLERALAIREAYFPDSHDAVQNTLRLLMVVSGARGDSVAMHTYFERVIAGLEAEEARLTAGIARLEDEILVGQTVIRLESLGYAMAAMESDSRGRLSDALNEGRRAAELARLAGQEPTAEDLRVLGMRFGAMGVIDSATVYLSAALERRQVEGDTARWAGVLVELGLLQKALGRPDSAEALYREALAGAQDNPVFAIAALNNLASVLLQREETDSARASIEKALELAEAGEDVPDGPVSQPRRDRALRTRSTLLANLANLTDLSTHPDSARRLVEKALSLDRSARDAHGTAVHTAILGAIEMKTGSRDSALALLRTGLQGLRETGDPEWAEVVAKGLASIHYREGLEARGEERVARLETALAYYDSAATQAEQVLNSVGADRDLLSIADTRLDVYAGATKVWLALEPERGEQALLAALASAERGRARALHQLMAADTAGAPESTADVPLQGPDLLDSALDPNAALLYMVALGDSIVTLYRVPGGTLRAHRVPLSIDELTAGIDSLRDVLGVDAAAGARMRGDDDPAAAMLAELMAARPATWKGHTYDLAQALVPAGFAAMIRTATEVVVVPTGPLNLLPFALLQPLADTPVRYTPSLAVLAAARARPQGRGAGALVVGNPAMPMVTSAGGMAVRLGALPGSEVEATAVSRLLEVPSLLGSNASEAEVRTRLPAANVIHLATHGYAYATERRARDSFLALAPGGGHDGLLTVADILDGLPSLKADLVILSACQTGLGNLRHAEGTVGLQRAFLARGARSVLVSLWSVHDDATRLLMERFYTHRAEGLGDAEALGRAQEELRSIPAYEHPRYWAAFQLVGAS